MRTRKNKLNIENVDIRDLLESYHLQYKTSGKNVSKGWIGVNCPFCPDGDTGGHLGIHLNSKVISCWKCGASGTIVSYLSKEFGSLNKALAAIEKVIPRELRLIEQAKKSNVSKVLLPKNAVQGLAEEHKIYLRKRGFDPDILADKYNLYHVGPVGEWSNRIIVPIFKHLQLVTFTSIDIYDESIQRYKHESEDLSIMSAKHLLYGEEFTDGHNIIITEGIFDRWRIGDGAVCLWGAKFTPEQLRALSKYQNIKLVGDGDSAGWKMNKELAYSLAAFSKVRCFDLDPGVDPDQLTKEEIDYIKRR